ncbi:uncharacterized protein KY384_007400 [Bacidia gigantensis]|uniref:uncharacterized protein n=1 Tax=Bacidia gigantensis TaxID=2732470 RepID=UPI001D04BE31|nr:uncharacterized protein KY384_007400 [Bacidia gigantensis]KAG8528482.1 hypothetical protein KY384_007400 [Bacidia gigantensis]
MTSTTPPGDPATTRPLLSPGKSLRIESNVSKAGNVSMSFQAPIMLTPFPDGTTMTAPYKV